MRILLTGFEPFGNYKENSSWAVAEKVAALGVDGLEVVQLPVSFAGVAAAIEASRKGLRVLLIEKYNCLGGAAANCLVMPFMKYSTKKLRTRVPFLSSRNR